MARRIPIAAILALATVALHAATFGRYGYFRDELYFIACAQHLAWGYVDQPPLVAFAAWLAAPFDYALGALRAGPIIASGLTVALAVELTRTLGGGRFAQWTCGALVLLLPAYLLLGNTLTTTSFEPFTWMLAIYCMLRIVRGGGRSWWIALALTFAAGLYAKYTIALLAVALFAGLLATSQRRALATPWFPVAIALTLFLIAPNTIWQAAHGWPIVEVLRGDAAHRPAFQNGVALEYRNLLSNAGVFFIEQLLYTNPLASPIWIAGIIAPFRVSALRDWRFVSIASVALLVAAVLLEAKGYYAIGIYGSLLAAGCVWLERLPVPWRTTLATAALALGILVAPIALPVLPVDALIAYTKVLGLTGRGGTPARLIQPVFAEEFGWDDLARNVADVYHALPAQQRARATIYADTYGDAGALDFFGPRYGLPPAISSQNSYYLWGTHRSSGATLIAVGATRIDVLQRFYRHVRLVATSSNPYKWIVEGPAPIYICTDPVAPLSAIWPHLRWYGA